MNNGKRRNKRRDIESRDRHYLALEKELIELRNHQIENTVWVELKQPILRGYTKTFVLRDDIARRADAENIQRALNLVNMKVTCSTPDFIKPTRRKRGKRKQEIIEPILHPFIEWRDRKMPQDLKKYFSKKVKWINHYNRAMFQRDEYTILDPWMFVISEATPYYITHLAEIDSKIESRIKEINALLWTPPVMNRLSKLHGRRTTCYWDYKDNEHYYNKDQQFITLDQKENELES